LTSDLQELYQEVIMDHNVRPRNFKRLADATGSSHGFNPFCGDDFTVELKVQDGVITDIGFQGAGCAISKSATSLMTEAVIGKSREEAERVFGRFREMITRGMESSYDPDGLGDLEALSTVARFPVRVKCATLGWHTMRAALDGRADQVSTE
jgi:nitrogen fixation NifU-like protein